MARALVSRPRLLLMDEPLGALDKKLREQMQVEIRRIHRSVGTTVLYVTHDQAEALSMSDVVAVMHQGRIAQIGAPEILYNQPNSPFVADFMGAGNVVRLRARRLDDGIAIEAGPHNGALTLAGGALREALPPSGAIVAHFRGEAARLHAPDMAAGAANGDELVLRGRIAQASYPGGVWRYSVRVGEDQFLVDDVRRLAIGEAVGIGLPAASLHLYAANP